MEILSSKYLRRQLRSWKTLVSTGLTQKHWQPMACVFVVTVCECPRNTRLTFNYCDQPKALMYEAFRWMCFF